MVGKRQTAMVAVAVAGVLGGYLGATWEQSKAAIAAVFTGQAQEAGKFSTSLKPGPLDRYDRYPGMAAKVFISRTIHKDPAADGFALKLGEKLEGQGIEVFPLRAPCGSLHEQYFDIGASTSEVFVSILTPEYFKRYWPMHELDRALAARDKSGGQVKLIPIVINPEGLKDEDFKVSKDSYGPRKVDVGRWEKNLDKLRLLTRETINMGESEEAFQERCLKSIVQAMQPDPFESPFDVFIAHTGQQKDFAVQLQDTLRQLGLHAFVDKPDLPQGSGNADEKMNQALQNAHIGVAVLSRAFLGKKHPMRELELICEKGNLMPILFDVKYEELEKEIWGYETEERRLLEQEEFEKKVLRTTAHLNVEDKLGFSTILCQRVAFSVLRELATKKCQIGGVKSQAAFSFVERVHTMLEKVVNEPGCLPYILKKDKVEAANLMKSTTAVLEHPILSKCYSLRGTA